MERNLQANSWIRSSWRKCKASFGSISPPTPIAVVPARIKSVAFAWFTPLRGNQWDLRKRYFECSHILNSTHVARREDLHKIRAGLPGSNNFCWCKSSRKHRNIRLPGKRHYFRNKSRTGQKSCTSFHASLTTAQKDRKLQPLLRWPSGGLLSSVVMP